jgi:hypothetical protein
MTADAIARLMSDLNTHPFREQFLVSRTNGPDMSRLEADAVRRGWLEGPREVLGGLLVEVGVTTVHFPFFALNEDELVNAAQQVQDFLLEEFTCSWPECPRHTEPLWPELESLYALWQCRRDRTIRMKIGLLPQGEVTNS